MGLDKQNSRRTGLGSRRAEGERERNRGAGEAPLAADRQDVRNRGILIPELPR